MSRTVTFEVSGATLRKPKPQYRGGPAHGRLLGNAVRNGVVVFTAAFITSDTCAQSAYTLSRAIGAESLSVMTTQSPGESKEASETFCAVKELAPLSIGPEIGMGLVS